MSVSSKQPRSARTRAKRRPHGPYTVKDYMALPDDGQRHELLDGELVMTPSPRDIHQIVVGNVFSILRAHVRTHRLGHVRLAPLDVVLGSRSVCQPDVIFVSKGRRRIITPANMKGAPDLAVEVLSPSRERYDRIRKREIYAGAGIANFWLVDPEERTLEELVFDKKLGDYRLGVFRETSDEAFCPALFPGLSIKLDDIFRDDLD